MKKKIVAMLSVLTLSLGLAFAPGLSAKAEPLYSGEVNFYYDDVEKLPALEQTDFDVMLNYISERHPYNTRYWLRDMDWANWKISENSVITLNAEDSDLINDYVEGAYLIGGVTVSYVWCSRNAEDNLIIEDFRNVGSNYYGYDAPWGLIDWNFWDSAKEGYRTSITGAELMSGFGNPEYAPERNPDLIFIIVDQSDEDFSQYFGFLPNNETTPFRFQSDAENPGEGTDTTTKTDTEESQVKAEVGGIDVTGICQAHGIDPEVSDVEILVQQKESAEKNVSYLTGIATGAGDTVLNTYDVEMLLSADGTSYGLVTNNFGKLTLTLYAGKEHAGKMAAVYQLHGENEMITHKDLKIDENGMVSITVDKLSTFTVALQKDTTTPGQEQGSGNQTQNKPNDTITSPKTGEYDDMIPWIVTLVLSMGALVFIATGKIRKVKR